MSKWQVCSQNIFADFSCCTKIFQVFRIRIVNEADITDKLEYLSETFDSEEAAQAVANKLNEEEHYEV